MIQTSKFIRKPTHWMIGSLLLVLMGLGLLLQTPAAAFAKDEPTHRGIITSRPAGNVGTWMVGGRTFVADGNTQFDVTEGALNVGACAKVRYTTINGVDTAGEIDSEPAVDCNLGGTATPTPSVSATPSGTPSASPSASPSALPSPDPSSTASPTDPQLFRGVVNSRPSGKVGTWVVGGRSFVANDNTELSEEEGALNVGTCAKVRFFSVNGSDVADEIDSEPAEDCSNSGTPSPTVTPQPTRNPREDSKVFARVDALPAAPFLGTWSIGGVSYEADSTTELEQKDGTFAVGACVRAEFVSRNGLNVLTKLETEDAYKCDGGSVGGQANTFSAYGVLDAFAMTTPSEWVVSGISYTVNANTKLEQEHGAFALGVFVEVKYVVTGTARVAIQIETHVAPEHGEDRFGALDSRPSDDWGTWVINGVSYQGDPAIVVELPANVQASIAGAATGTAANATPLRVQVNAYVSNGVNYATLIRALGNSMYLPVLQR